MMVIACATPAEAAALKKTIHISEQKHYHDTLIIRGLLCNREILFVQTGVGPKRAKTAAQIIVDNYRPSYSILLGAGGAVDPCLTIGDIIIIDKILRKQGPIHNTQSASIEGTFHCDPGLSRSAHSILSQAGMAPQWGSCLTTERFIHLKAKKAWVHEMFGVKVIEMESAAMARIFNSAGVPFINVRIVSDTAGRSIVDYEKIVGFRIQGGLVALGTHFLRQPRAVLQLMRFRKDMWRVRNRLVSIAQVLVRSMPELATDKHPG